MNSLNLPAAGIHEPNSHVFGICVHIGGFLWSPANFEVWRQRWPFVFVPWHANIASSMLIRFEESRKILLKFGSNRQSDQGHTLESFFERGVIRCGPEPNKF